MLQCAIIPKGYGAALFFVWTKVKCLVVYLNTDVICFDFLSLLGI